MSEDNRVALLAGAGLSANAGLPMSVTLAARLRNTLVQLSQSAEGTEAARVDRERAKCWLALFNFLNGGVRFQEGVLDRNPDRPVNIEQVAIAAEELIARTRNPLAPYAAGWHRRIDELEQQDPLILKTFVEFTYSRLTEELTLKDPKRASYLEGLKDLCVDGCGLDVFTLNYDLCIETALTAAAVEFSNGFDSKGVWSPGTFAEPGPVRLFKLHGSLDWVDDEVYGLCSLQFPRHEIAQSIQSDDSRPTLIFGTAHKLSAREPFLTLAYHFSQRVLKTKVLAIVGYSFGDEHVNQIIEQGMKKNSGLRVIVVSPDAKACVQEVRFLDRNPRVFHIPEQAEVALNKRLLRDQIRECLKDVSEEAPF
jgi:NAD-dependent SIR2 family protein deacetylase